MDKKAKRDALRAATIGMSVRPRSEVVTLAGDHKIEVREISYGARENVQKRAQIEAGIDESGRPKLDVSYARLNLLLVIESCFDPETGERVFEPADLDAMLALPAESSFVSALVEACARVSSAKGDEGRPTKQTETSTPSAS